MQKQIEYRDYTFRSLAISIKYPYEELMDHVKKEEQAGWELFSIQAVLGEPFTYIVTVYKK